VRAGAGAGGAVPLGGALGRARAPARRRRADRQRVGARLDGAPSPLRTRTRPLSAPSGTRTSAMRLDQRSTGTVWSSPSPRRQERDLADAVHSRPTTRTTLPRARCPRRRTRCGRSRLDGRRARRVRPAAGLGHGGCGRAQQARSRKKGSAFFMCGGAPPTGLAVGLAHAALPGQQARIRPMGARRRPSGPPLRVSPRGLGDGAAIYISRRRHRDAGEGFHAAARALRLQGCSRRPRAPRRSGYPPSPLRESRGACTP
jgi:hypothetical protein